MPSSTSPYQPYAKRYADGLASGSTAAEIIKDLSLEGKLQDGRDLVKGQAVADGFIASNPDGQKPVLIGLELDNLESVRGAAKHFLAQEERLDILILNAGIMAVPEGRTVDGFETQLGTNYFGHFLLFHLSKSTLLASSESASRVVTRSSAGHKAGGVSLDDLDLSEQGYNPMIAYAQSKTAIIHLANSIDRHYSASGIRDVPLAQGAATAVWAALEPHFDKQGGVYLADTCFSSAANEDEHFAGPGYAPHAFDEAAENNLWKLSFAAVGLKDDSH
ncbi:NAD(P)-binding protein [Aureobasidium subglaciale]|nr:NAD(P)-binding protein [Aureobasidium subglaciale]